MSERQILTAELVRSVDLSEKTKHLEFRVPEVERFEFTPGQFVSMKAFPDGREITRAYSIASPPRHDNTFDLCLNRVEEGYFSNYLCDLEPKQQVKFHGPHGYFVLKQPVRDSIFIATGTGIAPIRGMLHWLFAEETRQNGRQLWLVFGTRHEPDLYYDQEFQALAQRHVNFHYVATLSRENPGWTGARGYVQEHVREIVAGRKDMDAYICGLKEMVEANRALLKEHGWERKQIVSEKFD